MAFKARQKLTKSFSIDHNSEQDGTRYKGAFTTKKLSVRDLAAIGVRKAQLNGGYHHDPRNPGKGVDEQTDEFNGMIAHLELSLVEYPDWWDLDKISDVELMGKIYSEVLDFESSFLGRRDTGASESGQSRGSSEGDSPQTEAVSDDSGSPREVVGNEVPAALEP